MDKMWKNKNRVRLFVQILRQGVQILLLSVENERKNSKKVSIFAASRPPYSIKNIEELKDLVVHFPRNFYSV